jgi:bifunctional ADP-heptose synthase (sugar kinase/adenylyltransferase)
MLLGSAPHFPDIAMEVHDLLGAGDKVVTRFTIRGTHEGEFLFCGSALPRCAADGLQTISRSGGMLASDLSATSSP